MRVYSEHRWSFLYNFSINFPVLSKKNSFTISMNLTAASVSGRWVLLWLVGASAGQNSRELHCRGEPRHCIHRSKHIWVQQAFSIRKQPQPWKLWLEPLLRLGIASWSWEAKEERWNLPNQVSCLPPPRLTFTPGAPNAACAYVFSQSLLVW